MSHIDREQLGELLSAYVDGELGAEQSAQVERLIREDADARRLLDDLRRTVELVSSLPRHPAPSSIAEDVQVRVERAELLGDLGPPPAGATGRRAPLLTLLSTAAAVTLLALGWWAVTVRNESGPAIPGAGDRVASAPKRSAEYGVDEEVAIAPVEAATNKLAGAAGRRGEKGGRSGIEDESFAVAERTAPTTTGTSGAEGQLIAMASFDQKLRAGLGANSVRTHPFENETVRLQVTVRDEAERDAVVTRLASYLGERRAADLSDTSTDSATRADGDRGFYYRGDPGTNFAPADERQMLVHASRQDLDGLMDELARTASQGENVALVAGPISIRGLERSRTVLYGLGEPAQPVSAKPYGGGQGDKITSQRKGREEADHTFRGPSPTIDKGVLDGLTEALGLPENMLSPRKKPTTDKEPLEKPGATAEPMAPGETVTNAPVEVGPSAPAAEAGKGRGGAQGESARPDTEESIEGARLDARTPLVTRRLKALEESKRSREVTTPVHTEGGKGERDEGIRESLAESLSTSGIGAETPAEPYVTLVIQVIVAAPEPSETDTPGPPVDSTPSVTDPQSQ